MMKMKEVNKAAFDYLCDIDKKLWTRAYSKYPRFGHNTSNIVESLNSVWNNYRHMPPLQLLDGIYLSVTETWFKRRSAISKSNHLADVPMARFKDRFHASRRYRVFLSNETIAQVEEPTTSRKWVVNINQKQCDCADFYKYQSLCFYAIAAVRVLQINSADLFDSYFTTAIYKSTYRYTVMPVSIENLLRDNSIKPPILRKATGRPRTKRVRKGQ